MPDTLATIAQHRSFYANHLVAHAGSSSERLVSAFSSIERERFLGKGPWSVFVNARYIETPSDDPRFLYQDIVVAIDAERGINNGQPTLHAKCLAACAVQAGESVVHVGSGAGYYTAVLAALAGNDGRVTAFEIEADLADRARANLSHLPMVSILTGSACDDALPMADVIYVNAGATHPLASWLDALNPGGRLVFPLTPNEGYGVMLLITRTGERQYGAAILMPVSFIPCIGARDDLASQAVATAMQTRSILKVRSLRRDLPPDSTACCIGRDWWLSSAQP
jgi:protein-L-isoaspartate(D-aspartate) O-methyltransferase